MVEFATSSRAQWLVRSADARPACGVRGIGSPSIRWFNRDKRIRRRVLLTNDEGYGAEGLIALRAALIGAGFDALTIVPDTDRGTSGRRSRSGRR